MSGFKRRRVNLNRAGLEELKRIDGLDDALAEYILEARRRRGRFRSVEELDEVWRQAGTEPQWVRSQVEV